MAAKKNVSKKVPKKSLLKDLRFLTRGLKQSKKQASQVKKTGKAISKGFGKLSKALQKGKDQRELRQIERLLGEDFDTLAQARRALKKESKPVKAKKQRKGTGNTGRKPSTPKQRPPQASKKTSGKARSKSASKVPPKKTVPKFKGETKSVLRVSQIKGVEGKSPMGALKYVEDNADEIQAQLKPGQYFIARIDGSETRASKDIRNLSLKLQGSDSGIGGKDLTEQKLLYPLIEIVSVESGTPLEQDRKVMSNRERVRAEYKELQTRIAKSLPKNEKNRRPRGAKQLLEGLEKQNKEEKSRHEKERAELNAKIERLLKQAKEGEKPKSKKKGKK
jgi:hypothetical protein